MSDPEDKTPTWVLPEGQCTAVLVSEREALLDTSLSTSTNSEEPDTTALTEEASTSTTAAAGEGAGAEPEAEEHSPATAAAAAAAAQRKKRRRRKMSRGAGSRKTSKKKQAGADVYLTSYQHELLEWASHGFFPCGPEGLWPSEAEQEELEVGVGPVPVGPGGKATTRDMSEGPATKKRSRVTNIKPVIKGC